MKKLLIATALIASAVCAIEPGSFNTTYVEDKRFVSCEDIGGSGFYWLNSENADLWRLGSAKMEWIYLGSPRGANSGRKGTYQLLSDRHGGVYILHTATGEGWWTDGAVWKIIGEPSRLNRKSE